MKPTPTPKDKLFSSFLFSSEGFKIKNQLQKSGIKNVNNILLTVFNAGVNAKIK